VPKLAKRILLGAAILAAAALLGLLLLNLYVQSAATTAKIEKRLSASLRMPVRITSSSFTPWGGLQIHGISVAQTEPGAPGNFLDANLFRSRFQLAPLLRRRLVIDDITLDEPRIAWRQNEKGRWKFPRSPSPERAKTVEPEIPEPVAKPKPERVKPFVISVQRFAIEDGHVDFLTASGEPVASLANVELRAPASPDGALSGTIKSSRVSIRHGALLQDLATPFTYRRGEKGSIELPDLTAKLAGGSLSGTSWLRPETDGMPFALDLHFDRVDLNHLVSSLGGMPGQAGGLVAGSLALKGEGNNADTITGGGQLSVGAGTLRQYEFLQLLGQILQIEELMQLTFQRADAQFRVSDSKVWIDQITLESPNLKLTATGKAKFNGRLDLDARLVINQRIARQLPAPIEANFTAIGDAGERYVDFDVTGTLDKPKTNLRERIIGKSLEGQAVNLWKSVFGGGKKEEEKKPKDGKKKKKLELEPAASPSPIIPEVKLPPVPSPAASPALDPAAEPSP
jgi:type II secretion system protein N